MASLSSTWLHWLLLPWSGAQVHHIEPTVYWHARLMVVAWGLLAPAMVLVARFWKIAPGQDWPRKLDHKFWWHLHRGGQSLALLLALAGLWLIVGWAQGRTWVAQAHGMLGWLVLALGAVQGVSGVLRGGKGGPTDRCMAGDHFDMTPRRVWFERVHKSLGYATLGLAALTALLGLRAADAPRWMPLGLLVWWALLALLFLRWQRQGRCIDTYQAIWGPDPTLPGAAVPPVGPGVRRYADAHAWRARASPAR